MYTDIAHSELLYPVKRIRVMQFNKILYISYMHADMYLLLLYMRYYK